MPDTAFVHALTVDVEGFAESHAQSVHVEDSLLGADVNDREIAANLSVTLDLFAEHQRRATFFFLGRIARTAPDLVRQVADAGHEIGCHSLFHRRITGQTPAEFRLQLATARKALEDASGGRVIGFRAPDFSIGAGNKWAFDELAAGGFLYDSSVVPTSLHDVYGMATVPRGIFRWPNGLIEFPLPVLKVFGQALPIGGGGYFRLYPSSVTRSYFRTQMTRGTPSVFYIHPYEIGPQAPRLPGLPLMRRFRHYIRLGNGRERLSRLLRILPFTTMSDVLKRSGFLEKSD
ncbi:MAG: DUF3473 domain-containing protein [candidate division Zixibacteria bacterium]|nr:DUF3473 domain-containing protein [candidate division Zixibacteria bacterium]